jgi:hypothetical protein
MTGRLILAALAVLALLASPALAADTILTPTTDYAGCQVWTLCDDQASGTTCVTGALNNIIRAGSQYTWSAWADTSDATSFTVKLYDKAPGAGYSTTRALINASGDITDTNPKFSWTGLGGDLHAVLGGTLTNGVTVIVRGCRLSLGP